MKKIIKTGVAILITTSIFTGCATVTQDRFQPVTFNSIPSGAKVYIDGKIAGVTPTTIELDKGDNKIVTLKKDGYKKVEKQLEQSIDGWFWGNLIIGGPVGSTTDSMTGNMYLYDQNEYFIELDEK